MGYSSNSSAVAGSFTIIVGSVIGSVMGSVLGEVDVMSTVGGVNVDLWI